MTKKLVYIAGPYTAHSQDLVQANIDRAVAIAQQVRKVGAVPYVPHISIPPLPGTLEAQWGPAMQECLTMLSRCDGVIFVPGWESSRGSRIEFGQAMEWGLPVFCTAEEVRAWVEKAA